LADGPFVGSIAGISSRLNGKVRQEKLPLSLCKLFLKGIPNNFDEVGIVLCCVPDFVKCRRSGSLKIFLLQVGLVEISDLARLLLHNVIREISGNSDEPRSHLRLFFVVRIGPLACPKEGVVDQSMKGTFAPKFLDQLALSGVFQQVE